MDNSHTLSAKSDNRQVGRHGETLAERFLEKEGHRVVEKNWQCKAGEIDLITRRGDHLHFVEVKARYDDRFGSPLLAVHAAKQYKIRRLAEIYLATRPALQQTISTICLSCLGITFKNGQPHFDWRPQAFGI